MTSSEETGLDQRRVEALRQRVGEHLEGAHVGRGVRVAIVCSRFNGAITTRLLEGALDVLRSAGVDRSDITVGWVPGAFEIPLMALAFADGDRPVDAVITLGAVIRGETTHYEIVSGECARGVQDVQLSTRVPVAFGVLTVNTLEQALERSASDEDNKGREAATTVLEMVSVLRQGSLGS
ncbi:MAG TPA: 6,7-dimethyl-8-ribityllumazine synthase [Acidimicrobiales bacterium]|nr:6,7-dimethyl-8-ribityllumazine synthase [Acidimicrobiales bacterium]